MPSDAVNPKAVARARDLIDGRQPVLDSDWSEVQPGAAARSAELERRTWDGHAAWRLGPTEGASDGPEARCAFVCGDLRPVHRSGLVACVDRAAERRHEDVELVAHDLLQPLDATSG